jgi:hypothetical protein
MRPGPWSAVVGSRLVVPWPGRMVWLTGPPAGSWCASARAGSTTLDSKPPGRPPCTATTPGVLGPGSATSILPEIGVHGRTTGFVPFHAASSSATFAVEGPANFVLPPSPWVPRVVTAADVAAGRRSSARFVARLTGCWRFRRRHRRVSRNCRRRNADRRD